MSGLFTVYCLLFTHCYLMDYSQSLAYLESLIKFGIKPGLERITALCERFGNPQRRLRVIHITGTNGKGSTATFISSILREAGYRVGLYLSPYVHDVRERIQIDGRMIEQDDFAALTTEIKPVADDISSGPLGEVTEFEMKTLMAFLHFERQGVDFAVIEVGMGGALDCTNVVHPLVAVITNVSLDHTERLGDTIEKIAADKAGIIKTGSVAVTAAEDEDAWRVILRRCHDEGADVWRIVRPSARKPGSPSADLELRLTSKGKHFSLHGGDIHIMGLTPGLAGRFQHVNAATAVATITALERYEIRVPPQAVFSGIGNAYIPGRMEVIRRKPLVVIDGAHNEDAARTLARAIPESFKYERLILVLGMLSTHDPAGVVQALAPLAAKVIVTQSTWLKALPAEDLAEVVRRSIADVEVIERVPDAVSRALDLAGDRDLILVTGSFYTIGEVQMHSAGEQ